MVFNPSELLDQNKFSFLFELIAPFNPGSSHSLFNLICKVNKLFRGHLIGLFHKHIESRYLFKHFGKVPSPQSRVKENTKNP